MSQKDNRVKTVTLGCRFNFFESEVSKGIVEAYGPDRDVILINTCAVTQEAERQSGQAVRRAAREAPDATIIVSGCAANSLNYDSDNIFVIRNEDKNNYESYAEIFGKTIDGFDLGKIQFFDGRARAFLQIQNGCDYFCSYCIVPYTRGRSKSIAVDDILKNFEALLKNGLKEVVLSGIDITSYGKDLDGTTELADVVIAILREFPEFDRIRVSSMDPAGISDKLFDVISSSSRILPHFHLSVQSGDDTVLKNMRRRHTRDDVISLCSKIRDLRNDVVFGADFIAGFPGETADQFENTLGLLDETGISLIHSFPYSIRPGTLAASMIQNPREVVLERARMLNEKARNVQVDKMSEFVGTQVNILAEQIKDGKTIGKTDHFFKFESATPLEINSVHSVRITGIDGDVFIV